jgi:hypothetical protein
LGGLIAGGANGNSSGTAAHVTEMSIPTKKAVGGRGSVFADVEGESFPCVHEYWAHGSGGKLIYDDPNYDLESPGKWADLLVGLRTKRRAILTRDMTRDEGKNFERTGYIALYRIGDVSVLDGHLRFEFLKRIANISN